MTTLVLDFAKLQNAVSRQFAAISAHKLYRTTVTGDELWQTYLNSFPPGSNPIYRVRQEHDCSCCRQFIKAVGGVVAIVNGKSTSIWDIKVLGEPAYQAVADAMAKLVQGAKIDNVFLTTERKAGTEKTFEEIADKLSVKTWNHFHVNIPKECVVSGASIGPTQSDAQATHDVLARSLDEIDDESIATVLELINQNSLYRGTEHTFAVDSFRKLKNEYNKLLRRQATPAERDAFVWANCGTVPQSVSRIRNTSIGTLLVDLSNGTEMEDAVRKFEAMVAPANYKRPTALVTKKMVENAKAKVAELGLTSALERRYALLSDISINDILFADRTTRKILQPTDVFDSLETSLKPSKKLDRVDEISIERFITDVLPTAETVEVMVDNQHQGNFVSLVAPVDPTATHLFKWDNNFSWSYSGDVADSIKERVKRAGGNVTGDLCCRLAWFNHDDLDFHMREPSGYEIYFPNKGRLSPAGGMLDVDMNAGAGTTRTPVENIFYKKRSAMLAGTYELFVNQYHKREARDIGFQVEIDWMGDVHTFSYDRPVVGKIRVAKFKYSHTEGVQILESLPSSRASRTLWNVATQQFHKVNVVMLSPNYWGDRGVGNKHYFFMLDGCQNEETARGFYNEFLKEELTPHRKVLEMVGAKMRTDESAEQLSGLGFSSTQRAEILVRVKGAFTRVVKVTF